MTSNTTGKQYKYKTKNEQKHKKPANCNLSQYPAIIWIIITATSTLYQQELLQSDIPEPKQNPMCQCWLLIISTKFALCRVERN